MVGNFLILVDHGKHLAGAQEYGLLVPELPTVDVEARLTEGPTTMLKLVNCSPIQDWVSRVLQLKALKHDENVPRRARYHLRRQRPRVISDTSAKLDGAR